MPGGSDSSGQSTGIVAYGSYVPRTRLPLALIHGGGAKKVGPEKAVAGFDEDAITLAVAAGANCLGAVDRETVSGVYLATTSSPFREKQAAAFVARALDLRANIATVDFGGTLRAAASALIAANNAVRAEPGKQILVIATDVRLPAPRSPLEANLGDAAAAFLVGSDLADGKKVIAAITDSVACTDEIYDVWRGDNDTYLRAWEDRFNVTHGYRDNVVEACNRLFQRCGTAAEDYTRTVLYAPEQRSHSGVAKILGFPPEKVQEPLFGRVGNCGAAFAPLLLVAALERAAAGDRLLVGFYGDGAEALDIAVLRDDFQPQRTLEWHLQRGRALVSYDAYLKSRHLNPTEHNPRGGDGVPATVHFRERATDINLQAQRCKVCGTLHFPACRVCYDCYAKDQFEPVRLSDKHGRVLSYSFDYFFPCPEPPVIVGVCEVNCQSGANDKSGARVYVQMTDASPDMLRCDLPVEFVFRKIHDAGNRPNYFWKSRPLPDQAGAMA